MTLHVLTSLAGVLFIILSPARGFTPSHGSAFPKHYHHSSTAWGAPLLKTSLLRSELSVSASTSLVILPCTLTTCFQPFSQWFDAFNHGL